IPQLRRRGGSTIAPTPRRISAKKRILCWAVLVHGPAKASTRSGLHALGGAPMFLACRGRSPTYCFTTSRCRCRISAIGYTKRFVLCSNPGCHHNAVLDEEISDEITFMTYSQDLGLALPEKQAHSGSCMHRGIAGYIASFPGRRRDVGSKAAGKREDGMPESIYDVIQLIGTSSESWEKAAANAVEQASKSLRNLRIAEIVELDMQLDPKGKVEAYRAKVKLSFKVERS